MEKLHLFIKVHQLKEQGFKVAAIAKKLGISRNTVYKYLSMNFNQHPSGCYQLGVGRKS